MQDTAQFLGEWASAEKAGDTAALDALLEGDFTAVGPLGFTLPRRAWLARHCSNDLRYQEFSVDEAQFRPVGEGVVLATARINTRGSYHGHPIPEATRATLTMAASDGRWRLAAVHMSFIAGTAGAPPIPRADSGAGRPDAQGGAA